jgi:hypothetical protein
MLAFNSTGLIASIAVRARLGVLGPVGPRQFSRGRESLRKKMPVRSCGFAAPLCGKAVAFRRGSKALCLLTFFFPQPGNADKL